MQKKNGTRYISHLNSQFLTKNLPDVFKFPFARRYITSLLAKPFVILTGNSGTGKTRISKQFAEYLEYRDSDGNSNWLLVPVGADWTDNTHMLGFYNPLSNEGKGSYVKSETLKLIERANKNQDIPYFLILDEMNLSHVERYFADFLSHMETPDIPFYLEGYGELAYPANLFVVGTVNIDETTYMFSPKVLDRANVIEFTPDKNDVLKLFNESKQFESIPKAGAGMAKEFLKLSKEIRDGKFDESLQPQMQKVKELFEKIYDILSPNGYEFAYRTVKEIREYISAAYEICSEKEQFDLIQAEDEQLLQKVLPKIHGNTRELKKILDQLADVCANTQNELDLGRTLKLSKDKIEKMKGKLARVQYASFI